MKKVKVNFDDTKNGIVEYDELQHELVNITIEGSIQDRDNYWITDISINNQNNEENDFELHPLIFHFQEKIYKPHFFKDRNPNKSVKGKNLIKAPYQEHYFTRIK